MNAQEKKTILKILVSKIPEVRIGAFVWKEKDFVLTIEFSDKLPVEVIFWGKNYINDSFLLTIEEEKKVFNGREITICPELSLKALADHCIENQIYCTLFETQNQLNEYQKLKNDNEKHRKN